MPVGVVLVDGVVALVAELGEPTVTVCWGAAAGAAAGAATDDGAGPLLPEFVLPLPLVDAVATGTGAGRGGETATTSWWARAATPPGVVSDPTTHPKASISRIATAAERATPKRWSPPRGGPGAAGGADSSAPEAGRARPRSRISPIVSPMRAGSGPRRAPHRRQ